MNAPTITPRDLRRRAARATAALSAVLLLGWGCSEGGGTPVDPDGGGGGTSNQPPTASAGADRTVSAGLPVTLDASGSSDPDGDPITVSWALSAPTGSTAAFDDAASLTPTFTPDLAGVYTATATISDGTDTAADAVAITAENTTSSMVVAAAAGGSVSSADGLLTLDVPAGALTEDTEIRITRAAPGQIPASLDGLGGPGTTVYDLQPSGLQFSTPAELSFIVENGIVETAEGITVNPVILLSESDGVVDPLSGMKVERSGTVSGAAVVSGGLSHFSVALVRKSEGTVDFQVMVPETVNVDEAFAVSLTMRHNASQEPLAASFLQGIGEDTSQPPVGPSGGMADIGFNLPDQSGIATAPHSAVCSAAGAHAWSASLRADIRYTVPESTPGGPDEWLVGVTADLSSPVTCTAPVDLDVVVRPVNRAGVISAAVDGNEILHGTGPERWNAETGGVTPMGALGGGNLLAIHEADPGIPFAVDVPGRFYQYQGSSWTPNLLPPGTNDQMRQLSRGEDGRLYGAGSFGDVRRIGWDAQADALSLETLDTEKTVAVTGDEERLFGVRYLGDNTTFSASRFWSADSDGANVTDFPEALDVVLDEWQQNRKDIACLGLVVGKYVCLLTVGEQSPGFLVDGQPERLGVLRLIVVDTQLGTAQVLEASTDPVVGAHVFLAFGAIFAAWANQVDETMEFREIRTDGAVGWSLSQNISPWCPNIRAFAITATGERAVASCLGDEDGAESLLLSLRIPLPGS